MTNRVLSIIRQQSAQRQTALMQLKMDVNAEVFTIIDRRNMLPFYSGLRPPGGIAKVMMPQEYATAAYCIVGIIDNDQQFNCKFKDGAIAELVDANVVDMSQ
ncbi:hypothetical protein [Shewanella algae]|uniref:hypothetical protein n=1 Tax=Shewanella algae TaxID=38313 RepID=UPI0011829707|nr:hypothetical protein [Shewanella algae]MDO8254799.1 hypothetical protein [Shewanella algae]TVL50454.1 hypothetical protein AYI99_08995 [Shewanella algae]